MFVRCGGIFFPRGSRMFVRCIFFLISRMFLRCRVVFEITNVGQVWGIFFEIVDVC